MKFKLLSLAIGLSSLMFMACGEPAANNSNTRNTNAANTNRATPAPTAALIDCSKLTKEEYEKNKAKCEENKGSSTIGQGVNDSWLWFKTKAALAAADDLRDSTINVDVANDVVTLKGTVANAAQKASAEKVAKGIEGVKSVTNQLQVKPADSVTNQMVNGNTKPTPAPAKK
jgi:hyperosmotically inducible periplasmic protein